VKYLTLQDLPDDEHHLIWNLLIESLPQMSNLIVITMIRSVIPVEPDMLSSLLISLVHGPSNNAINALSFHECGFATDDQLASLFHSLGAGFPNLVALRLLHQSSACHHRNAIKFGSKSCIALSRLVSERKNLHVDLTGCDITQGLSIPDFLITSPTARIINVVEGCGESRHRTDYVPLAVNTNSGGISNSGANDCKLPQTSLCGINIYLNSTANTACCRGQSTSSITNSADNNKSSCCVTTTPTTTTTTTVSFIELNRIFSNYFHPPNK
jgi:hypothetical protein